MKEHKINEIEQGIEIINRIAYPHRYPYNRITIRFGKPYAPTDGVSIKSFHVPKEGWMDEFDTIYMPVKYLKKLIQEVLYDGDDIKTACEHHLKMTYHPGNVNLTMGDLQRLEKEIKKRYGQ